MSIPTDAEILIMQNVPVRVASKYLGLSLPATYFGLQQGVFPFGKAIQNKGSEYTYHISPGLLVAYQRGTLKIEMKGSYPIHEK